MSVELTELPSGLKIVTEHMPGARTVAIGVHVAAGARSEAEDEHGLAHLLEHMAFKGTSKRDAKQIAEEIEQVGGDLNAATSVEQTAYYARLRGADLPIAVDILSDIVTDPIFDPAELEREKNVIEQEIGAVEDTPDDLVFDLAQQAAFPGQPLGRSILGTRDTVNALDRNRIAAFRERHYRARSTIVAAAGDLDHAALVAEVSGRLGALASEPGPAPVGAGYRSGDLRDVRDLEQAHVVLSWPGCRVKDDALHATHIFTSLLGGGMSSRLFQEVREKRGLAYAIYAFHWPYSDTGMFGVYAGTAEEDLDELIPVVFGEIEAAAEGANEREVERAKAQLLMSVLVALETPGARAEQLARQVQLFGRPLSTEEVIAKIEAVTVEDVRRAGRAIATSAPSFAGVGPVGRVPHASRLGGGAATPAARAG